MKAYENLTQIISKYDDDFPEMLSSEYLIQKGYWIEKDDGTIEEVKKPEYSIIALLVAMREITNKIRNGTTIEEIVNEKELCEDGEEV
ncbi:hypothetical protein AVU39_gp32 [Sulfolobus monocaudavirus SMV2]|uniref:hypothetical protein n=1 Tax=Sulfolobus monocaudavirus SMV2 TaxID=1580591 RepID=UPI0006D3043F|nr:hypothetical protein AVU39_gp32 [Sulfolobus monocaudavirus SMV2]AIZ11366.1 hypothetical protein [Sulfolobus monocaudavirus SMV2]